MRLLIISLLFNLVLPQFSFAKDNWTALLHDALKDTNRLRIRTDGTCHRSPKTEKTLLDLRDIKKITQLVQNIKMVEGNRAFHCMCCGSPTLEFYKNDDLILSLGFHHSQSLRWPKGKWPGDGLLTKESSDFLVQWLADHGIDGPKKEKEENILRRKKSEAAQKRWLEAMPSSLKPYWKKMGSPLPSENIQVTNDAITKEFPDVNQRILALLKWYGSGEGPWSGFSSYEDQAENLLLKHSTKAILTAIKDKKLTSQQTEGLARLLGGWSYSQQRPKGLELVPQSLKNQLLEHCLKSSDEDKRGRAKNAFYLKQK